MDHAKFPVTIVAGFAILILGSVITAVGLQHPNVPVLGTPEVSGWVWFGSVVALVGFITLLYGLYELLDTLREYLALKTWEVKTNQRRAKN